MSQGIQRKRGEEGEGGDKIKGTLIKWPLYNLKLSDCYYCSRSEVALESVERKRRERDRTEGGERERGSSMQEYVVKPHLLSSAQCLCVYDTGFISGSHSLFFVTLSSVLLGILGDGHRERLKAPHCSIQNRVEERWLTFYSAKLPVSHSAGLRCTSRDGGCSAVPEAEKVQISLRFSVVVWSGLCLQVLMILTDFDLPFQMHSSRLSSGLQIGTCSQTAIETSRDPCVNYPFESLLARSSDSELSPRQMAGGYDEQVIICILH
ncbi:unnamed protein product [Leuciscus chuanchicus]